MNSKKIILKQLNHKTLFKKTIRGGKTEVADMLCDIVNTSAMSYKEIGEVCDLSPHTVKRIALCEKPYNPSTETLRKVCEAFGFTLELK